VNTVKEHLERFGSDFQCLVYCQAKETVNRVAGLIGCKPFHSGISKAERESTFEDWVQGKEQVIVCTSLLGCGININGIQAVYHFQTPKSIIDFVRESGQAVRSGKQVESYIFASIKEEEDEESEDYFGREIMRNWVLQKSKCRRITLSSFLDNCPITCILLPNANLCDICRQEMSKSHPRHPVRLVPLPLSPANISMAGLIGNKEKSL